MSINIAKYWATVTNNVDPENRGRISVACVGLLGDEETELPMFVEPVHDWGWFYIPDVGELVEIEVIESSDEDEQHGQMSIDNLDIKWRSKRAYGNEEGEIPTSINEDFTSKNIGKRRGFATPIGHVFMFDDTENEEQVSLKWQNKSGENSFFAMDKDGSIVLSNKTGTTLFFNAKDGQMSIVDQNGNVICSDSNGIKLIDSSGNSVEMKNGAIIVLGQSGITISCKDAIIDAGNVEIAGNTEAIVLGTTFLSLLNTHTHPTGVGPSGPPTVPFPSTILSTKVKAG